MLAAFVVVFGFVTAGFVATISAIYQNSEGGITMSLDSPFSAIKGFVLCMFVGPYILAKNTAILWLGQKISGFSLITCMVVSMLWSFCIGIVAIQSLIGLGLL